MFGAGANARRYIRQPWAWHGLEVIACVRLTGDDPAVSAIDGLEVLDGSRWPELNGRVDAAVVCSDAMEADAAAEVRAVVGDRVPLVRPFEAAWPTHEPGEAGAAAVLARLRTRGVAEPHARWLVANRQERHDALFGTLPPERTELHLRRYWLSARFAEGETVLDAACGTGYGASLLGRGAASVLGVDIDAEAVEFASAYHASPRVRFTVADVTRTPCADASFGLITSFETIEHLAEPDRLIDECARVLRPGGTLVLSTPNDGGLTAFHEQSLTMDDLDRLLSDRFEVRHRLGQRAGNEPATTDWPPGIFEIDGGAALDPESLIVIAARR